MTHTIEYNTYEFIEPAMLTECEFNSLKPYFDKDPHYNLCPPAPSFSRIARSELTLFLVSLSLGCIIYFVNQIYNSRWLDVLLLFICLVLIISVLRLFLVNSSYEKYLYARAQYFYKLEEDIANSKNYVDFISRQKKSGRSTILPNNLEDN